VAVADTAHVTGIMPISYEKLQALQPLDYLCNSSRCRLVSLQSGDIPISPREALRVLKLAYFGCDIQAKVYM
jgi:hypothetical protein